MKAGIIAAGDGSRLKSEGVAVLKPLVRVGGMPLIERLLRSFKRCGISDVVCIINEQSLEVRRYVETLELDFPVQFVVQTTPSSMHSLFALSPFLAGGKFLLSTVDSVFDEGEFSAFIREAEQNTGADGILGITDFIDDENPLYVQLDASGRIQSFSKSGKTPWITGGIYVFSPSIFREIDAVLGQGIERLRKFLGYLVEHEYHLEAYRFSKIVDVDHVGDIQTAESLLRGRA
ncbi:MAG TPA: sugar phosphate nucleotidyltransferase [Bacteroidota bacterium]|jgi:NDP-sugar pyrophosphorylase family protein|nr:sugar phosphate nucleotidyltransferase [Bacteroidota bacterium]